MWAWGLVAQAPMSPPQVKEEGCPYFREAGLRGVKSSLSKSSCSSSELRRVPGTDCEGRPLLLLKNEDDGGEVTWELARLPRGVILVAGCWMLDMLKRFGREKAFGKPLSLYSGGVVGWLCAGLFKRTSEDRR
jgi:hypothetical protein